LKRHQANQYVELQQTLFLVENAALFIPAFAKPVLHSSWWKTLRYSTLQWVYL